VQKYPSNYFTAVTIPPKDQQFFCGHHVLLAHASVYRLGKSMDLNGSISFKTNGGYKIPLTNSTDDALATQRAWDFNEGWFANPVFINGVHFSVPNSLPLLFNSNNRSTLLSNC
jgi:beta-glucosidase